MRLSDCTMANIAGLVNNPISTSVPTLRRPTKEEMAITVCQRLAHMISKIITIPNFNVAEGAKWYLSRLPIVPISEYNHIVKPFSDRLTALLREFEGRYGTVNGGRLAEVIRLAGTSEKHILVGQPVIFITGPALGSPQRYLATFISLYMWRQSLWD